MAGVGLKYPVGVKVNVCLLDQSPVSANDNFSWKDVPGYFPDWETRRCLTRLAASLFQASIQGVGYYL